MSVAAFAAVSKFVCPRGKCLCAGRFKHSALCTLLEQNRSGLPVFVGKGFCTFAKKTWMLIVVIIDYTTTVNATIGACLVCPNFSFVQSSQMCNNNPCDQSNIPVTHLTGSVCRFVGVPRASLQTRRENLLGCTYSLFSMGDSDLFRDNFVTCCRV